MKYYLSIAASAIIALIIAACSTVSTKDMSGYNITYLGDHNIKTRTAFNNTLVGGLSGITYNPKNNRFYAISDDRGDKGKPRFYEFEMTFEDSEFDVKVVKVTTLKNKNQRDFRPGTIDFEGISILKNGNILLSTEGEQRTKKRILPEIMEYSPSGHFVKSWPVPDFYKFEEKGKITKGVRINKGFESLASTPDYIYTFTANEDSLLQDGAISSQVNKGVSRVTRYRHGVPTGTFAVDIEKIPNPSNLPKIKGDNGVVDMIALDKDNIVVMERSWISNTKTNHIKLFHVDLKDATDISKVTSLGKGGIKTVNKGTKKLLLDFDSVVGNMSIDSQRLDNIEGITLGPRLLNGNQTIVVVSDNNFSRNQRTLFMAFEIKPK